jgi:hypothetical protein
MAVAQPADVENTPPNYAAIVASWSPEERVEKERKFVRKIDFRLLPILVR